MKKKTKLKENEWRTKKDLEIIKAFIYTGITGMTFLTIDIYDKIKKKVFTGTMGLSSWTREDILKRQKK